MALAIHSVAVRVYDEAHGDRYVTDHGFRWWCPQEKNVSKGNSEGESAFGSPYLQFIEDHGLTMRAFVSYSDTIKAQWFFSVGGASIEDWRPESRDYVYRLFNRSSLGGHVKGNTTYLHEPNPNFAFTLASALPPNDFDFLTGRPYFDLAFGSGMYGVHITDNQCHLWEKQADDSILSVLDLGSIDYSTPFGDSDEAEILVRCENGEIAISVDSGKEYKVYKKKNKEPIYIPSGTFILDSKGAQFLFGLHGLDGVDGYWLSPQRKMPPPLRISTPSFSPWEDTSFGSNIVHTDLSDLFYNIAQFRVDFSKGTSPITFPFNWNYFPVLESTLFEFPVESGYIGNDTSEPWKGFMHRVAWEKPQELSGGSCTINARFPDSSYVQHMRFRKVEVEVTSTVGETVNTQVVFTGWISKISLKFHIGYVDATIELVNAASLFQRMMWSPFDVRPLDTMTRNDAADFVLGTEGWDITRRSWDYRGTAVIKKGTAANPNLLLKSGGSKFETLREIFSPVNLEIASLDDGGFRTVPRYWHTGVVHNLEAKLFVEDRRYIIKSFDVVLDYTNSATMVYVSGKDIDNEDVIAFLRDTAAETDTTTGRFQLHRSSVFDEMSGVIDLPMAMGRALDVGREALPLKRETTIPLELNIIVGRRDQLLVNGVDIADIPDGSYLDVLSISGFVEINIETGMYSAQSVVGARLLS